MNVIDFRLNKLNDIDDINDLIYNRMDKSVYHFDSIIFLPESKNKKYIYYLNNKYNLNLEKIMKAKKIDTDVIELYANDNSEDRRIGIAHIPTKKCSRICALNINDKLIYTAHVLPERMRMDPHTGRLHWEPSTAQVDFHKLRIEVSDGNLSKFIESEFFVNAPIKIVSLPTMTATVGDEYGYKIMTVDRNKGALLPYTVA